MDKDKNLFKDLFPKIINNRGKEENFKVDEMVYDLNRETGLDEKTCENVVKSVIKRIIEINKSKIKSNFVRELICVELSNRDLGKYRNIFVKGIDYNKNKFSLKEEFIQKYKNKEPDWGDLGYFVYKRTYSRIIHKENRKEEFWETIKRVVEGVFTTLKNHCTSLGLPWDDEEGHMKAEKMYKKIWNFKFTPAGRGLWMMGTNFIKRHGSMALNSCAFVSTEDIDIKIAKPFCFTMDALMLGVGVGFDTKGDRKILIKEPAKKNKKKFVVPDSREGWVEALNKVIEGYFLGKEIPEFDYSAIRKKGEPIKGFGGVASGYKPLEKMLEDVKSILDNRIGKHITSLNIVDIMNLIAKCVIAGNVRRSAEIALGNAENKDFILAKQDKDKLSSHRWASNNSIIGKIGMDYTFIVDQIVKNGEPAVIWLENSKKFGRMCEKPNWKDKEAKGVNPCAEQTLESYELCCLSETFPSRHKSYEEFEETLKYAYLYAKTVTLINTHWKQTNAVMLKNRRIGISQTGIIDAFCKHGRREMIEWSKKGYNFLKDLDEEYSKWLCVPKSIKITTVKPSGTVSLLAGVSAGIHYPHSEHYIRRIRISDNSDLLNKLEESNYKIEKDSYSPNTSVIEFPVKKELFTKGKRNVSIWEQLMNAVDYQKYWSDNQVSVTVSFKEEEKQDIKSVLECAEDKLKCISFVPISDHGYKQAPYEEIDKEKYEKMKSEITPLYLKDYNGKSEGEMYCDNDSCIVNGEKSEEV